MISVKTVIFLTKQMIPGINIFSTIQTATNSILSILNSKTSIKSKYDPVNYLEETDIRHKIAVLNMLINEYNNVKLTNSISLALSGLSEILNRISNELYHINGEMVKYNNRYISYIYSPNFDGNIEKIKKYIDILNIRYSLVLDLLKLHKT